MECCWLRDDAFCTAVGARNDDVEGVEVHRLEDRWHQGECHLVMVFYKGNFLEIRGDHGGILKTVNLFWVVERCKNGGLRKYLVNGLNNFFSAARGREPVADDGDFEILKRHTK